MHRAPFCAGFCPFSRSDCSVVPFCAGMGYHFRRGMGNCCRLRRKCPQIRPDHSEAPFYAGKGRQTRPEMPDSQFCAGMRYLFQRRMENCSRLRRKTLPNPPGLLRDTLLRRNGVSFPARNGKLLPPAQELAALPARNAPRHPSAREWGIIYGAGFFNWKLSGRKIDKFYWCKGNFYHLSLI